MDETGAHTNTTHTLRKRVEQALRVGRSRELLLRMLEQLLHAAPVASEDECFARRQLAALLLETHPWQAALHLRRVLALDTVDDGAHALMGLSQALLGNHRMAVQSYRNALALSPANPWYLHNLGHMLDVALHSPREALRYLTQAHRAEPTQAEVSASLAHCLARVGKLAEALTLARALVVQNPGERDLRALAEWIAQGAPARSDAVGTLARRTAQPTPAPSSSTEPAVLDRVEQLLRASMTQAGRDQAAQGRARQLCRDFVHASQEQRAPGQPNVLAAAVEYALARVDGLSTTQRDVAARHRVSVSSLRIRYATIRTLLALRPSDPRYS